MKPLTMSEEREKKLREDAKWGVLVGGHERVHGEDVLEALAEIDTLRAMVGKLEQEHDIYQRTLQELHALCGHEGAPTTHGLDYTTVLGARLRRHGETTLALAASQAEVRELREALSDEWAEGTGTPKSCGHAFTCVCVGDKTAAALATAPGDDTALREVCRKVALEGIACGYSAGGYLQDYPESARSTDAVLAVNRILGHPGDDAKEGR